MLFFTKMFVILNKIIYRFALKCYSGKIYSHKII